MNSEDSRNILLAIVLSGLVLIGWQYFYAAPQLQKDRQAQTQTQASSPGAPGAPSAGANGASAPLGAAPVEAGPKTRAAHRRETSVTDREQRS